jgi:hypothetical protein
MATGSPTSGATATTRSPGLASRANSSPSSLPFMAVGAFIVLTSGKVDQMSTTTAMEIERKMTAGDRTIADASVASVITPRPQNIANGTWKMW